MLIKLPPLLTLTLLTAATISAHGIEARFSTDKTSYLVDEPLFVTLTVSNTSSETIWIDFKSPDAPTFCENFGIEVPEAESPIERACGYGGSCAGGLRKIPAGNSITIRRLLNREFRLRRPGTYAIRTHTTIVARGQDLFDAPPVEQVEATDILRVQLQSSNASQLQAAFQPYVEELNNADPMKRAEAASAIAEIAPPFLEDVLIEMTNSDHASAAVEALRKANTIKTREALASIAAGSGDPALRVEAIDNLGRTRDTTYLSTLTQLLASDDKRVQNAAAESAGILGGPAAFTELAALVSSSDMQTRVAGANGLGHTRARQAVSILIRMLLDSDADVRQAAVNGLSLLTRRVAFYGDEWSDVTNLQSASDVHQRWVRWWNSNGIDRKIYGMADCVPVAPLD